MPITTFLVNPRHTQDGDIREELSRLPVAPIVEEFAYSIPAPRWWNPFRYRRQTYYSILWPLKGSEYQIMNFYRDGAHSSFNTNITKEMVLAYLYGLAAGKESCV